MRRQWNVRELRSAGHDEVHRETGTNGDARREVVMAWDETLSYTHHSGLHISRNTRNERLTES